MRESRMEHIEIEDSQFAEAVVNNNYDASYHANCSKDNLTESSNRLLAAGLRSQRLALVLACK